MPRNVPKVRVDEGFAVTREDKLTLPLLCRLLKAKRARGEPVNRMLRVLTQLIDL
jgi:hypothetical protein